MIDYKKIGIKYFKRSKFKDAIFYFSLAYEKTQERNLLFLIQICSLGEENAEEAKLLFDYYMAKVRAGEDDEGVEEILKIAEEAVISFFKSIYSVVIMLPAEFSGYFNKRFIVCLSFASVFLNIFFTTFDGISSIISTISSKYSSSNISRVSTSVEA